MITSFNSGAASADLATKRTSQQTASSLTVNAVADGLALLQQRRLPGQIGVGQSDGPAHKRGAGGNLRGQRRILSRQVGRLAVQHVESRRHFGRGPAENQ